MLLNNSIASLLVWVLYKLNIAPVSNFLDSILIESDSGYNAKSLLLEIHKRLGLSRVGSVYKLMDEVSLEKTYWDSEKVNLNNYEIVDVVNYIIQK